MVSKKRLSGSLEIEEEGSSKKSLTESEKVRSRIADVKSEASVNYGSSWKSEKTEDAVRILEKIDFKSVVDLILAIEDVDERWTLASEFSVVVADIVMDANDCAEKLVNGSCGEFCENTSRIIAKKLWVVLCDKKEYPSIAVFDAAVQTADNALDDFGYSDWKFIENERNNVVVGSVL
jgi:hypothetical protein